MNRNPIFYFKLIAVASMLLVSCMRPSAQDEAFKTVSPLQNQSNQKTYVYECSHGFSFTVRLDHENAYLFSPDKTARLPIVPSASGEKYSNGPITFWSKGEEALLDTGNTIYRNCKNNRAKAIWENAKLNGIDFRAVGNEPGWILEIMTSDKIRFVSNYGQDRHEFATPKPKIDKQAHITTYTTHNDANTLTVTIHGKPCRDSMSGESFATIVTVTLDNTKFQGCGRALH
jgi:membrane-bound inhibitor of C-type lysozyme